MCIYAGPDESHLKCPPMKHDYVVLPKIYKSIAPPPGFIDYYIHKPDDPTTFKFTNSSKRLVKVCGKASSQNMSAYLKKFITRSTLKPNDENECVFVLLKNEDGTNIDVSKLTEFPQIIRDCLPMPCLSDSILGTMRRRTYYVRKQDYIDLCKQYPDGISSSVHSKDVVTFYDDLVSPL